MPDTLIGTVFILRGVHSSAVTIGKFTFAFGRSKLVHYMDLKSVASHPIDKIISTWPSPSKGDHYR